MKLYAADENTWLYPDRTPEKQDISLYLARGGHTAVQLVTDAEENVFSLSASLPAGVHAEWYQLCPTYVEENSGPATLTTLDYDRVKDFVTRQTPFSVFDITFPIKNPEKAVLRPGCPAAFFVRFSADRDVSPVSGEAVLSVRSETDSTSVSFPLTVTNAEIPALSETGFGVCNWLKWHDIANAHKVPLRSPAFWEITDRYMEALQEVRTNHFLLPAGEPVRDENGDVVSFDFSFCEEMAEHALAHGFSYIYGGFVARFREWDHPEIYLLWDWDKGTEVTGQEGFRQLRIYFRSLWDMVCRHGWQDKWMQCLVDEPQFQNSMHYRALSCICRQCMPGVTIHDPVESTEVGGAMDIWCVKQAVFAKYRDIYKKLQAQGEHLWVYTCGFPAGKWMNRTTDLPLAAGRLPFWMCALEGFEGFLHWGFNAWGGVDPYTHNCFPSGSVLLPPGDGFIVYPGNTASVGEPEYPNNGAPVLSVRAHGQLFGAEDCELLRKLPEEKRNALCNKLCRDFEDYENDPARLAAVRRELLLSF